MTDRLTNINARRRVERASEATMTEDTRWTGPGSWRRCRAARATGTSSPRPRRWPSRSSAELACVHAPAGRRRPDPLDGRRLHGRRAGERGRRDPRGGRRGRQGGRGARRGLRLRQEDASARLASPVWAALALQSRLSDVVVFDDARGQGAGARWPRCSSRSSPTSSARRWWRATGFKVGGVVAVAWDGGKEASRAVRTALPLLEKASKVVILSAPAAASRQFDPAGLQAYLDARGVKSEIQTLEGAGDAAPRLLKAARRDRRQPAGRRRLRPSAPAGIHLRRRHADVPRPRDAPSLFLSH